MAGSKPNNFPLKTPIDGTEEVYTQTSNVNNKFTVNQIAEFVVSQISGDTDAIYTETITQISSTEISFLGSNPVSSSLVLSGNNFLEGQYEVIYQAGNLGFDILSGGANPNGIIHLIAYTANTFSGNALLDGFLFIATMSCMAFTAKAVVNSNIGVNLFASNVISDVARHFPNGTVKFIMVDETFTPIDILGGNGELKVTLKTQVKSYN
jgi:hypothetical protein